MTTRRRCLINIALFILELEIYNTDNVIITLTITSAHFSWETKRTKRDEGEQEKEREGAREGEAESEREGERERERWRKRQRQRQRQREGERE